MRMEPTSPLKSVSTFKSDVDGARANAGLAGTMAVVLPATAVVVSGAFGVLGSDGIATGAATVL